MESDALNYLSCLPEDACYLGDRTKGEIEIVRDRPKIAEIIETYKEHLKSLNIQSDAARVGIVYEDDYIVVIRDPVLFPAGTTGSYFRIFQRSALDGSAGVVMLPFCQGFFYLRKVFRHATRSWELEFPKGYKPKDLSLDKAVEQEISEEIGLEIKSLHELGCLTPDTGISGGIVNAYWVVLEPGKPHPEPEEGEAFGPIIRLTHAQILEKIRAGKIRDGVSLSALQLAQAQNFLPLKEV